MIELRPSSSHIWTNCALAPQLIALAPPEEQSDPAREGTCAAWCAELVLNGVVSSAHELVGTLHENGWVVDFVMANHVMNYVTMLRERGGMIHAERRVVFNEFCRGTSDAAGVTRSGKHLVVDLKYGYDIVEPTSPQVVIYAAGMIREVGANYDDTVELGIYQPRAHHARGPYRSRTLTVRALYDEAHYIHQRSVACQSPDAEATPGKHCRHCRGAARCTAVAHEVYDAVHRMQNGEQRDMTPHEIANELTFIDFAESMFKARKDAIRAEAEARIQRGQQIPGWVRQSGYANRRWTVPADVVFAVTGYDPTDSAKMVTPLELERRGADPETVALLTETPRTKATLKPFGPDDAAQAFGG